jgi:enediyne biosynthesis protein E4
MSLWSLPWRGPAPRVVRRGARRAGPLVGLLLAGALGGAGACGGSGAAEPLADEAAARGLDYVNRSGGPDKRVILEANGAGVALIDLGNDGDLDVVFAQGLSSFDRLLAGPGADVEVFVNDGTGHFERAPGPGLAGWWTGLATGDVDGDGDQDLVVGGFGDVALLLQDDAGRLVRRDASGVEPARDERLAVGAGRAPPRPPAWTTSLAFFDADRDGVLDLYVGRYLELDPARPPLGKLGSGELALPCRWKGYDVFCGPRGLVPQKDRLLRGRGDGTFVDVTDAWLPDQVPGFTLGVRPFDADGDGDTDLYVASDSVPNQLFENRIDVEGRFVERAFALGVALSQDGRPEAGMGIDAGDVDRDGAPDLVVTNFSDEPTALYLARATAQGWRYDDATYRYGLYHQTRSLLSWGVHLVDLDGDGWLELFTANGHVYPQADLPGTGTSYAQRATLWRLGPEPRAVAVPPASPRSILAPAAGARGTAVGDLDGDLDPDIVLARIDGPAALGIDRLGPGNRRLEVRCLGPARPSPAAPRTPRDASGARVTVRAGATLLVREVGTAAGYQSASSPWLDFGLGRSATYDAIVVRWPSGREESLAGGATRRRVWIREGEGIVREEALP